MCEVCFVYFCQIIYSISTLEETRKSGESYFKQVTKILDTEKTEITYNSEWLSKMNFADVIGLCSKYTVARILERDDFKNY
ncbi:MAG: hypothetical protein FIA99_08485 [Ruminiclostridium sp.]|nr:hypothetical protein [Ruminiclostridium sp.]